MIISHAPSEDQTADTSESLAAAVAGFVRSAEQRGHQGGEPVRERAAQAHDAARPREDILVVRQHHHIQDPLRQHHGWVDRQALLHEGE